MTTMTATSARATGMSKDEKFVIFASSLGLAVDLVLLDLNLHGLKGVLGVLRLRTAYPLS